MGEETAITWCDHTFNGWWGCYKISPGCKHCYAAAFDRRVGGDNWKLEGPRRFFGEKHWNEPRRWARDAAAAGVRRRVFCSSMADVFEDRRDLDVWRTKLWALIRETPELDWLLLTKRPENFGCMLPWYEARADGEVQVAPAYSNVWLGVTAEDQEHADRRVPILRETAARVRFVSYEPAIGPIEWSDLLDPGLGRTSESHRIHWLIFGDESGTKRRPAELEWARQSRDACELAGVAFHFKQWCGVDVIGVGGTRVKGKLHLPILDGAQHAAFPEVRR